MAEVGNCKILGRPIFQGKIQHAQITTINMCLHIEIMLYILIQSHQKYIEVKKFNYVLEIGILRNCPEG